MSSDDFYNDKPSGDVSVEELRKGLKTLAGVYMQYTTDDGWGARYSEC